MCEAHQTLRERLGRSADRFGDNTAVIDGACTLTYAELYRLSLNLSGYMRGLDVGPASRMGILLPTGWQFAVSVCASILGEFVFVPLDPDISSSSLSCILGNCRLSALIIDSGILRRLTSGDPGLLAGIPLVVSYRCSGEIVDQLSDDPGRFENVVLREREPTSEASVPAPSSLSAICFTSGSTGNPKGVMHSHRSLLYGALATSEYFSIQPGHSILVGLPLAHTYSLRHLLSYLFAGGTLILSRDFLSSIPLIEKYKPRALLLVPSALNILLRAYSTKLANAASHLEFLSIGTAAVSDAQIACLKSLLPDVAVHLPYGLTEARVGFLELAQPRTLKHVCKGIEIFLEAADRAGGSMVAASSCFEPGTTGEIVIHGDGLMIGYWGQSEAELEELRLRGFHTGDMGRVETDGRITLLSRMDAMINVGGKKVYPSEVEEAIAMHPMVKECTVSAIEDPHGIMGKQLIAIVVADESGISELDLREFLLGRLEPYKIPKTICFRSALPVSAIGKVPVEQLKKLIDSEASPT